MAPLLCTLLCYLKVVSKQESGAAIIQTISVPKKHVWWWQMSDFQSNPVIPQRTDLLDICLCEGLTASTSKNTKWQQVDSGRLFWWSIFCWVIEICVWLCESGLKQTSPKYSLVLMSVCAAISISETAHSLVRLVHILNWSSELRASVVQSLLLTQTEYVGCKTTSQTWCHWARWKNKEVLWLKHFPRHLCFLLFYFLLTWFHFGGRCQPPYHLHRLAVRKWIWIYPWRRLERCTTCLCIYVYL